MMDIHIFIGEFIFICSAGVYTTTLDSAQQEVSLCQLDWTGPTSLLIPQTDVRTPRQV